MAKAPPNLKELVASKPRTPDECGFVTVGIKHDVFEQLSAMKDARASELGGVRLSWTDFFRMALINPRRK